MDGRTDAFFISGTKTGGKRELTRKGIPFRWLQSLVGSTLHAQVSHTINCSHDGCNGSKQTEVVAIAVAVVVVTTVVVVAAAATATTFTIVTCDL